MVQLFSRYYLSYIYVSYLYIYIYFSIRFDYYWGLYFYSFLFLCGWIRHFLDCFQLFLNSIGSPFHALIGAQKSALV